MWLTKYPYVKATSLSSSTHQWCLVLASGFRSHLAPITKRSGSSCPSSLDVALHQGFQQACKVRLMHHRPGTFWVLGGQLTVGSGPSLHSVQFSQFRGPQPARNKYFQDISLDLETWINTGVVLWSICSLRDGGGASDQTCYGPIPALPREGDCPAAWKSESWFRCCRTVSVCKIWFFYITFIPTNSIADSLLTGSFISFTSIDIVKYLVKYSKS